MCSMASSASCCFKDFYNEGVGFPHRLTEELRREVGLEPLGVEETARGIDRTVNRQAVLHSHHVVFLTMARGGVDGAGSLLQRDVISHHA